MSNKRDLKAFVRFDGSGRIVAGSLILRKNKPKVGKWHEIQAYECCNYIPSPSTTTTTTTQGGGGGGVPFELLTGQTAEIACQGSQGTVLWFVSAPGENQVAYVNEALTIPYANSYIQRFGDLYLTNSQGVMQYINNCAFITTTTTTTQALTFYNGDYSFNPAGDICNGTGQFNLPVLFPNGICGSGTVTLAPGYTWSQYGIFGGSTVRLKDPSTNNIIQLNIGSGSSAFSFGCTASC